MLREDILYRRRYLVSQPKSLAQLHIRESKRGEVGLKCIMFGRKIPEDVYIADPWFNDKTLSHESNNFLCNSLAAAVFNEL